MVSIHAPRAGCDGRRYSCSCGKWVSIHAPRAGCDVVTCITFFCVFVSIHAPRAGCDLQYRQKDLIQKFQSTHPGRGATRFLNFIPGSIVFQSTHPGRGATLLDLCIVRWCRVSIHAPRAGCDPRRVGVVTSVRSFQSTHPGRGATALKVVSQVSEEFQSTHPGRGATGASSLPDIPFSFQSTHPGRGATV